MKILYELPSPEEYINLRVSTGLSSRKLENAKKGLSNSIFSVIIRDNNHKLVGMGRIIGDGGCHYQVVDIAIDPKHQKKGYGKEIMKHIQKFILEEIDDDAYISLMADIPADKLYSKFGFNNVSNKSIGMAFGDKFKSK